MKVKELVKVLKSYDDDVDVIIEKPTGIECYDIKNIFPENYTDKQYLVLSTEYKKDQSFKKRTVTKFLYFPKMIDWKIKWLKKVSWIEYYMTLHYLAPDLESDEVYHAWVAREWINNK
ncbi:hypothetical protein KAR91_80390 [Candidatus Pacearchaeota archaeon]|nr:hypothetical protein [Candidatus Pacearchaeota archaeon]